ncbi:MULTISPECIES: GumC family protein [Methylobacterium]|uniref:Polysaccharide biosynthesis tyrosine autokinase n=1 Tax=Methylobacterium longum TaxID=767694 RepID=A0ABT8AWN8_9HYPH|nr:MULTISPECIES: polysaccharide biosynthesis tyrosine autokinase [Methylobacterium]MCJ2098283.1 polysaccharide biosynthesis tyrosine autokinase [Methylobacterium sp. E-046]MDN3574189.1 polysaccharide biosynthesis tyrosine autokinase [Methylobacterium longum]GJE11492.1 Chromosome partition protein Smc [Methylobacterium longum]
MSSSLLTVDLADRSPVRPASQEKERGGPLAAPLARIWRRRALFAAVFATIFGLAVTALVMIPPQYVASGSVIVAEAEPGANNASMAWIQKIGDPADIESQILVIRSPRLLRIAIEGGLAASVLAECRYAASGGRPGTISEKKDAACLKLTTDNNALVEYLQKRYAVTSSGRSRIITIGYKSPLPETAQTMANGLINAFLEDQREAQASSRKAAADWLHTEIGQLDESIRADETRIQTFRRRKGLLKGASAPISAERLTNISHQLASAEAAKADAAARLGEIESRGPSGAESAPAVLASPTIVSLKQQLSGVSAQLANQSTLLGANHPAIRALTTERASLRARIEQEIGNVAQGLRKTFEASSTLARSLRAQLDAAKTEAAAAMDDEASIEGMVRNAEIKRTRYADLVKRTGELETERRILTGSTRLVSLAELPQEPFSPKAVPLLAGGLVLAGVLAAAAALLRDVTDRRVRTSAQLMAGTGAPVFAQLPCLEAPGLVGRLSDRHRELDLPDALERARVDPTMQNVLRNLHAHLVLAGGGASRVILVTSSKPREGKSFTAFAMAGVSAANGRRVLLIECDLRRPNFESSLGLGRGPGLGGVLRGEISPAEAVVSAGRFDVIPAGTPTPDSTELLMSSRMVDFLAWSRRYDLVLLDTPPTSLLMDASLLARHVDGVLCCARYGQSQLSDTIETVANLRRAGGAVLGIAMTMVRPGRQTTYDAMALPEPRYAEAAR